MSKTQRIITNNLKTIVVFGIYAVLLWFAFGLLERVIFWTLSKSFTSFITVGLLSIIGTGIGLSIICGYLSGYIGGSIISNRTLTKGFYVITIIIVSIIKLIKLIRLFNFENSESFIAVFLYVVCCLFFVLPALPKRNQNG